MIGKRSYDISCIVLASLYCPRDLVPSQEIRLVRSKVGGVVTAILRITLELPKIDESFQEETRIVCSKYCSSKLLTD